MYATFLILRVGEYRCAILANQVQEIVHLAATTRAPGQPSVLHGLLNLHGEPIPVLSLPALFNTQGGEPGLYAPLAIVQVKNIRFALLADSASEVLEVDKAAIQPLGANQSFNDCAEAQFVSAAGTVIILAAERLLLAKERECIAALQVQMKKRIAEAEGARG